MAHQKRNAPELPAEAYQLAEMYHLGQPLKLYRANFTNGLGCVLAILGFVVALETTSRLGRRHLLSGLAWISCSGRVPG